MSEHTVSDKPQGVPVAVNAPPKRLLNVAAMGTTKNLGITVIGEFCGTFLFLLFAYCGIMVGKSSVSANGYAESPATSGEFLVFLLYGASCFGCSVAISVWVFYRVSGGLFNPAITFAFMIAGLMHPVKGVVVFITQLVAGIAAAGVAEGLTPGKLAVDNGLGPHVTVAQGFFLEMFGTALLVITVFMLAVEKHRATFLAPIGIGIALFMGHMVCIYYTGAGLNPARTLGPAVVEKVFPGYHWIYWIGPGVGGMLAAAIWKLLKVLNYEAANSSQDSDGLTIV